MQCRKLPHLSLSNDEAYFQQWDLRNMKYCTYIHYTVLTLNGQSHDKSRVLSGMIKFYPGQNTKRLQCKNICCDLSHFILDDLFHFEAANAKRLI